MRIYFDLANLYYWPQYEPVFYELTKRGHHCTLIVHRRVDNSILVDAFLKEAQEKLNFILLPEQDLLSFYSNEQPDWLILGNDNLKNPEKLPNNIKTALLYHGIGVKSCYYTEGLSAFDVRFTEGEFRLRQLQALYPEANFVATGFAKLDPLFQPNYFDFKPIELQAIGLDPAKKTLLYAPTFYPSSIERMPKNWPEQLKKYNIIIKPHFFTWSNEKYHQQRALLTLWQESDNVYLAPAEAVSLLPYMQVADLLISEASSALFEFAALNKPVLWLDYLKLRWSYRGPLKFRFTKRMDKTILPYSTVAMHVASPSDLVQSIENQLQNINEFSEARKRTTTELIGITDGKSSLRIADYIEYFRR